MDASKSLIDCVFKCKFATNAKVNKLLSKSNPNAKEVAEAVKTTKAYKENQNGLADRVFSFESSFVKQTKTIPETKSINSITGKEPPRRFF